MHKPKTAEKDNEVMICFICQIWKKWHDLVKNIKNVNFEATIMKAC